MTIEELKMCIEHLPNNYTVEIHVRVGGVMGGTPTSDVKWAHPGIDWDHGKFILEPSIDLQPVNINDLFPYKRKDK